MTATLRAAVSQAIRRPAAPAFGSAGGKNNVGALVSYVVGNLGPDLGLRLLVAMGQREGLEALQAAAERHAHGLLHLDVELWARAQGEPVEGIMAGVGLIYGRPGAMVMDFHVVRTATTTAPRLPRAPLLRILSRVGAVCDKQGAWCYGGSRWGLFSHVASRHPELGFTEMERTYQHADGHAYRFFVRPPRASL
jgi:hypothetical protein